jgi:hypothetical protein
MATLSLVTAAFPFDADPSPESSTTSWRSSSPRNSGRGSSVGFVDSLLPNAGFLRQTDEQGVSAESRPMFTGDCTACALSDCRTPVAAPLVPVICTPGELLEE